MLTIQWLGQAGICLQTGKGTTILIDPYLTETISKGYRPFIHARLMPPVLVIEEIPRIDAVLYTHDHMDHMDPNTVTRILWHSDAVITASSYVCRESLEKKIHVPEARLHPLDPGESMDLPGIRITAVYANHCPGAVGYLLASEGKTLYFCGDTQLFYDMKTIGETHQINCAFLCFNGQEGNMDISSAVQAAKVLGAGCVVPVHYGMYADNSVDPGLFELALKKACPQIRFMQLEPGREYQI